MPTSPNNNKNLSTINVLSVQELASRIVSLPLADQIMLARIVMSLQPGAVEPDPGKVLYEKKNR